jgi:predicted alternative tryptophan synthase beta-subunit
MSNIQSLLESAGQGWKNMQSDAAKLAAKWEKTGLLEGLRTETEKNNMSLILENQAKQLVVETSQVDGGTAAFTPGTGNNWAGIALPLVRKVFGQIAAKEFVSVQPMNLPSGLVFYLDFQYGNTKDSATNTLLTSTPLVNQFTVTKLLPSIHSQTLIQLMVVVSMVLVDLLTHSLLKVLAFHLLLQLHLGKM